MMYEKSYKSNPEEVKQPEVGSNKESFCVINYRSSNTLAAHHNWKAKFET